MIATLAMLADAAMSALEPDGVGQYAISAISGGAIGAGVTRLCTMRIKPDPLNVRNADSHYVTREQHDRDITRLYDQLGETSAKLNQIIGLVQGIRDAMTQRRPRT